MEDLVEAPELVAELVVEAPEEDASVAAAPVEEELAGVTVTVRVSLVVVVLRARVELGTALSTVLLYQPGDPKEDAPVAAAPVEEELAGVTVTVRVSLVVVVLGTRVELGLAVEVLNTVLPYQLVDLVEDAEDPLDAGT